MSEIDTNEENSKEEREVSETDKKDDVMSSRNLVLTLYLDKRDSCFLKRETTRTTNDSFCFIWSLSSYYLKTQDHWQDRLKGLKGEEVYQLLPLLFTVCSFVQELSRLPLLAIKRRQSVWCNQLKRQLNYFLMNWIHKISREIRKTKQRKKRESVRDKWQNFLLT